MKVIIAGSRKLKDPSYISQAVQSSGFDVELVISGCAPGVDTNAIGWSRQNNIAIKRFPADWHKDGRRAGLLRNIKMAECADALIAIWDGKSTGTAHMIKQAQQRGLKTHIYIPGEVE